MSYRGNHLRKQQRFQRLNQGRCRSDHQGQRDPAGLCPAVPPTSWICGQPTPPRPPAAAAGRQGIRGGIKSFRRPSGARQGGARPCAARFLALPRRRFPWGRAALSDAHPEPLAAEILAQKAGLAFPAALAGLTELEIAGCARNFPRPAVCPAAALREIFDSRQMQRDRDVRIEGGGSSPKDGGFTWGNGKRRGCLPRNQ